MVNRVEILAVIQARGGSKGLPNKNLLPLRGHPLVAYSVASALGAARITRTIISTDSETIADVAHAYGAEAPFRRPAALAGDDAPDLPLFEHALQWLWEHERYRPEIVVQLRPTTPLRPKGLIDRAIALMQVHPAADCVRAVTYPKQNPYKMWAPTEEGLMDPLLNCEFEEPYNMPRQMLPVVFWQTGHVDVIRTSTILERHSLTGRRVKPIIIEPLYCIDIDEAEDLEAAASKLAGGMLDIDSPVSETNGGLCFRLPAKIDLVVFDFDGVFTDNRVLVSSNGTETVICDRGDGYGISLLRQCGIPLVVLSTETNPVTAMRCRKLGIECIQGVEEKLSVLLKLVRDRGMALENTVYVGNDVNDLLCLKAVGCGLVPADAHPSVRPYAAALLTKEGGRGAVRELCDAISAHRVRDLSNATDN